MSSCFCFSLSSLWGFFSCTLSWHGYTLLLFMTSLQLNHDKSSPVLLTPYIMHIPTQKPTCIKQKDSLQIFTVRNCSVTLSFHDLFAQAEFQNVIDSVSTFGKAMCLSASISWNPQRGESQESSFVLGFNSNTPQLNSSKVCKFCLILFPNHLSLILCGLSPSIHNFLFSAVYFETMVSFQV